MQRTLLVAAVALVALLAVLWLLPASVDEPPRDADELPRPEAPPPGDVGRAPRHGPSLHAGLPTPPRDADEATAADESQAPVPHGPFAFTVRSAESDLLLAEVTLSTVPEADEAVTVLGVTGEDGEVQVEWPHAATLLFAADKEGYVRHRDLARADTRVEVLLYPGVAIRGRVVRADGGAPVPSATVHVFDEDAHTEVAAPVTDEQGRFVIAAVRPNHPVVLVVSAPGLVPIVRRENFEGAVEDLELEVGGGSALRVRVRTTNDRPAPDLPVTLDVRHEDVAGAAPWPELDTALGLTLPTDEEGRCRFAGIPKGVVAVPAVRVTERLIVRGRWSRFLQDGLELEDVVRLPDPATLTVRVVDDAGSPVPEADLDLYGPRGTLPVRPRDRRDAGVWTFEDLDAGAHRVHARVHHAPTRGDKVTLRPGLLEEVVLVVPRGRSLRGVVEDKRGHPIWRAQVGWRFEDPVRPEEAWAPTDSKGAFLLRRLTGASGTLVVDARDVPTHPYGFEGRTIENVAPGVGGLRIVLDDTTRVTGRCEDLPEGTDVRMRMLPGTARDDAAVWLDEKRAFRRRGPPPGGRGVVFVFRAGRLPPLLVEESQPFDPEEVRDLGLLIFEDANPRKGRVVGGDGRPLRGARVDVDEPWSTQYARTDRQGDFAFGRLPDKPVRLRVTAEEHLTRDVLLDPVSQYTRQVIEMTPAGRLQGAVVDERYQPVDSARVVVLQPRGRGKSRRLEATGDVEVREGRFAVDLPAGDYVLRVVVPREPRPPRWAEEEVTVRRGQTARVALRLRGDRVPWATR